MRKGKVFIIGVILLRWAAYLLLEKANPLSQLIYSLMTDFRASAFAIYLESFHVPDRFPLLIRILGVVWNALLVKVPIGIAAVCLIIKVNPSLRKLKAHLGVLIRNLHWNCEETEHYFIHCFNERSHTEELFDIGAKQQMDEYPEWRVIRQEDSFFLEETGTDIVRYMEPEKVYTTKTGVQIILQSIII